MRGDRASRREPPATWARPRAKGRRSVHHPRGWVERRCPEDRMRSGRQVRLWMAASRPGIAVVADHASRGSAADPPASSVPRRTRDVAGYPRGAHRWPRIVARASGRGSRKSLTAGDRARSTARYPSGAYLAAGRAVRPEMMGATRTPDATMGTGLGDLAGELLMRVLARLPPTTAVRTRCQPVSAGSRTGDRADSPAASR